MKQKLSVHDKAVRLLEGGIVDVDGHAVKLCDAMDTYDPCLECEMDCLCHRGSEMCSVCEECDMISGNYWFLCFVEPNGK